MVFHRALVTGGAGFIGSHLTRALLRRGLEVVVVDDLSVGKRENLPDEADLVVGDIRNAALLDRVLKDVDVVFHQAARVSIRRSVDRFVDDAEVNISGTLRLLDALRHSSVRRLIYASSMAVYGDAEHFPVDEEHPLRPTSPYGISKLAAEQYCLQVCGYLGKEALALRYFNTFGPCQSVSPYVGVISIFIDHILKGEPPVIFGDGEQVRDFISVHDIVEANLCALDSVCTEVAINVGTGKGTSVNTVAQLLLDRIASSLKPVYAERQPGEPTSSVASTRRAGELLGWSAGRTLENAIDEVIDYHCARLGAMQAATPLQGVPGREASPAPGRPPSAAPAPSTPGLPLPGEMR